MSLNGVMLNAVSGMRVTQAGLDVVSQNISNADSIGYVRRRLTVSEQALGDTSGFARADGVQRMLDRVVQRQLWNETSGAGYTAARSNALGALDQVYGPPTSTSTLGAVFGRFTQSLQKLQGDPSSNALRSGVITAAEEMANRLRSLSGGIQSLRREAEEGIAAGVTRVNEVIRQIQSVDSRIRESAGVNSSAPLRDERDRLVTELSRYIDIRTSENESGSLSIFTTYGITLFAGSNATVLTFDAAASVGPDQFWSPNDAERGVGTIRAQMGFGGSTDLIATNSIRSGELAAFIELRDRTLVQAQNQIDELAAAMASALSDREIAGTPVTAGAAAGFEVDIAGLAAGNQITMDYTDSVTGAKGRFTFVRADSAAAVARIAASGLNSGDNRVIGIDFTGFPTSMAAVTASIQAALDGGPLGVGFTASNTGGTILRIVDDGSGNTRNVDALTARPTVVGTTSAQPAPPAPRIAELPFFVDKGAPGNLYTGSFEGRSQLRGLSGRIEINPELVANKALLVQYSSNSTTPQGESTRVDLMLGRLTSSVRTFSPQTGIGGTASSLRSTIVNFAQRIVEAQGNTIESGRRLNDGQQIALNAIQSRFAEQSGVSVDQEMSDLVELQNAYAANARVISAVKELMDVLLRI
ncbi:MAG: flagellar hook-associated protein FlgK [Bosea sp.]|jgi:flagellar hook-associated protein 1 FlgK|nr:flagellar hook-associated protein FlgK [Bosea sp. (in: a-proteobacteria)]